ncbi:MAG: zinc ribbon domain-containing protein [Candidatus Wallbacteria bacterium]|nr:zinc ribbon domain-containing protein [Candidatus Wallbacteria bacterium]
MPIFVFTCQKCHHDFEELLGMVSGEQKIKCPKCGSEDTRKSPASFTATKGKASCGTCGGGSCSHCH